MYPELLHSNNNFTDWLHVQQWLTGQQSSWLDLPLKFTCVNQMMFAACTLDWMTSFKVMGQSKY